MKKLLTALNIAGMTSKAFAYSGGPPNGKTGAPGEGTGVNYHSSFPINSGDGLLTIDAPITYEPGQVYTIAVELSDLGQSRWGFELTPLDVDDIAITDPAHTQLSTGGDNMYVKQTSAATFNGTDEGPVTWTFDWTAPTG